MKSLTMPQAVLFGAVLVAASLYFASVSGYRYQINTPNGWTTWMVDKFTGELWYCVFIGDGPVCSKAKSN